MRVHGYAGLNEDQISAIYDLEFKAQNGYTEFEPLPEEVRQKLDQIRVNGKTWTWRDDAVKVSRSYKTNL